MKKSHCYYKYKKSEIHLLKLHYVNDFSLSQTATINWIIVIGVSILLLIDSTITLA